MKQQLFWTKSVLTLLVVAIVTLSFTQSFDTQTTETTKNQLLENGQSPKLILPDFRSVAKKAIPAVVSIKVQTKKRSSSAYWGDSQSEDPLDFFGGNLWKFFNIPRDARSQQMTGQASGVIVSPEGYILTNSHVVNEMENITVQLSDGREFTAKVLGEDPNSDLALIKISAKDPLPYLNLGNSDQLEVGEWISAAGNPFGLQGTLTVGVISAKGRNNLDIVRYEDFIQTDASINTGNSGGPLLNLNGEVIGINTAIATNSSSGYMGIGFAIPSNMAKYVMDEILSNGRVSRGFLGITLQSIDYNLAQAFDLNKVEGALVTSVLKDSPAEKAGLKPEDIILKYDNRIVDNAATLRNNIYMMHPGTKVTLTVLRDARTLQIPVIIEEYNEETESKNSQKSTPQTEQLGVEVETLTPELADSLNYNNEKGVVVTKVQPGSPAAFAGFKKGALILSVNRKKVQNKEQFYSALSEASKDRPTLFQVKQGDVNIFISIQLE